MSISLLLEMAVSSNPDRTAVVSGDLRLTAQQLSDLADGGAAVIAGSNAEHVVYVGTGGVMLPLLIFASARAGLGFTPINYRLSAESIQTLIRRLPQPLVIADSRYGRCSAINPRGRCSPTTSWPPPPAPTPLNTQRSLPTPTRSR